MKICGEAKEYEFAAVCVNPCYAALICRELAGSGVKACVTIGFPLGATTKEVKAAEAKSSPLSAPPRLMLMVLPTGSHRAVQRNGVASETVPTVVADTELPPVPSGSTMNRMVPLVRSMT